MSGDGNFHLYVTNIDSEGPFLKLTGQIAKNRALTIEDIIRTNKDALEKGTGMVKASSLSVGLLCIAQYQDGGFYRAKITNLTNIVKGYVGVNFIDYGNNEIVTVNSIRAIPDVLLQFLPQASDFFLSRIIHKGGRWDSEALQAVSQLVRYKEMPCAVELRSCNRQFIRCHIDQCPVPDLSNYLTENHIGIQVTVPHQESVLLEITAKMNAWQNNNPYQTQNQLINVRPLPTANTILPPMGIVPNAAYPRSDFSKPVYVSSVSPDLNEASQNSRQKASRNILPPRPLNRSVADSPSHLPGFKSSNDRILSSKSPSPVKTLKKSNPSTYKSRLLALNSRHEINISFAKDGPELFAIQLKSDESALSSMVDQINRLSPESLAEPPMIGSVCLGRLSEDNSLRRAVVMGLTGTQCKLFFVDLGMTDLVSYYDIFYIPEELVTPCVFSLRFCLSGIKNLEITEDIKKFFYEIVTGKVVTLVVVTPEGPPLIQYGELFLNGRSVKDILIQKRDPKLLSFHPIQPASVIGEHSVLVSFVDSCTKFFIQLSQNIDAMTEIMNKVADHCSKATPLSFHEVTCGLVCCALFPDDQSWYRAQVISIKKEKITVKYVDYGNEQEVTADLLRPLNTDLIKLRSQGIHCALKGYENKPFDQTTTNYLETLTLEKILRIKVCKLLTGDVLLVELYDDSLNPPVNIAQQIEQLCVMQNQAIKEKIVNPHCLMESEKTNYVENPPGEELQHGEYKKRPEKNYYDRKNQSSNDRLNDRPNYNNDNENKRFNKYDKPQSYSRNEGGASYQDRKYDNRQGGSPHEGRYRDKNKGQKKFDPRDKNNDRKDDNNKSNQSNGGHMRQNQRDKDQRFGKGGRNQNNEYENDHRQPREPYKGKNKKYASSNSGSEVNSELGVDPPNSNTKLYSTSRSLNNPAPFSLPFQKYSFDKGAEHEVNISWFINPKNFYAHILTQNLEFKNMMLNIPNLYRDIQSTRGNDIVVGSSVLARFPEDGVLYRAEVLKIEGGKYLVHFIDFGNKCLVDGKDLWQLEHELMMLPKMAVNCSLSDIASVNGEWKKNPDVNSQFSAPSYRCIFKSIDADDTYSVSLLNTDGTDIRDALLKKKLAICCETQSLPDTLDEPLDIPLLLGQYLSVYVTDVESLSKFYIQINSYKDTNKLAVYLQTLECMLNNYEVGKSNLLVQGDEVVPLLMEKNFIIYVNDIVGQSLKITMYNTETYEKMKLFTPDDDSPQKTSVVCPHPVFHKHFGNGYVSHVESLDEIYLQYELDTDIITELLDALYQYYEENGEALTSFDVGRLCVAQSDDGNWYRSKILQGNSDNCLIQFIDYGNQNLVPLDKICALIPDFHDIPQLCQPVKLGVPSDDDAVNRFKSFTDDKKVYVELMKEQSIWKAKITLDNVDVVEFLFGEQTVNDVSQKCLQASTTSVLISHIDSPGQFWLQLLSDLDNINNLQAQIQDSDSFAELSDRDLGKLCIAKYSGDDKFYRAIILDADNDITTVRFIDYGNTDVLDNSPSSLKSLTNNLEDIPPYAMKCSVNATPTGTGQWTEQAAEQFIQLLGNIEDSVEADFVLKDVTTYVDIYVGGQNITKKLVEAGYANPAEISDDGKMATCFASHVSSPSEFWIQLESSIHDLEAISEELIDAANFSPLTDIEEEVICAANFPEDGQWYRAQVIINGTDGTEVLFMDYGNAALTNELRSLPDTLKAVPALSRKCALQKPSNIKNWSKEAEMKFVEMAADGATIFQISFIASGDISIVELFIDGKSVTNELVSLCEVHLDLSYSRMPLVGEGTASLVKISHCSCPEDFWVHLNSCRHQLEALEDALKDAEKWDILSDVKEGDLCVSLFPEDGLWYRSKVLDHGDGGTEVQYIDYGNTSITDKVRAMPIELGEISPLAKHCSLLIQNNAGDNEKFHEKFAELAAESLELQMEIVDSSILPMTVILFIEGEDISYRLAGNDRVVEISEPTCQPAVLTEDFNLADSSVPNETVLDGLEELDNMNHENEIDRIDDIDTIVDQVELVKKENFVIETSNDNNDTSNKISANLTIDTDLSICDKTVTISENASEQKKEEVDIETEIIQDCLENSKDNLPIANDPDELNTPNNGNGIEVKSYSSGENKEHTVVTSIEDKVEKPLIEMVLNSNCDNVENQNRAVKEIASNKESSDIFKSISISNDLLETDKKAISTTTTEISELENNESESSDKDYEDVSEELEQEKTDLSSDNTQLRTVDATAEDILPDTVAAEDCDESNVSDQKKETSNGKKNVK